MSTAMIAITTRSSTRVKALGKGRDARTIGMGLSTAEGRALATGMADEGVQNRREWSGPLSGGDERPFRFS
ncbi:MAG: hypothetical protein ACKO40_09845 [Planctomycetaceae bacterium]